jgi:hypothetical protein
MGASRDCSPIPAPSQPSQALLFLGWPLLLSLTQLRLANTEWLCFVFPSPPYMPPLTLYMRPITFRIYKFSLEGLGKASSAREARRAAASIAGCMSLTAKYGQLTVGLAFLSRPARLRREPRPTSVAPCRNSPTTSTSRLKTSIVASLLLVLCHLETFSILFLRHLLAIAGRAFHLFWLLVGKLCPRAVTFNEALASD